MGFRCKNNERGGKHNKYMKIENYCIMQNANWPVYKHFLAQGDYVDSVVIMHNTRILSLYSCATNCSEK